MQTHPAAAVVTAPARAVVRPIAPNVGARVAFMDNLRYLMVLLVILYHAVAAYAPVAPHWKIHDTPWFAADLVRELFDVFMMPVLFFVAGYFVLSSLEKKGVWEFLKDKVMRLLVPWALAVFIIAPLAVYDTPIKPVRPFWNYWPWYLGQFQVQLRFSETPVGATTQLIYWFISLLFVFFLAAALVYAVAERRGTPIRPAARKIGDDRSVLVALATFGLLMSAAYFVLLLVVPDSSWFTLYAFLEFQVTRLVPYAGCFAFGIYAQSRGWFVNVGGKPFGSLTLWGAVAAVLSIVYLVYGQPVFADTSGTANLGAGYLLGYAVLRSFLLLALLVVFVSFGARYWNRTGRVDQQLAATSYNIYLVHIFVILGFQAALLGWTGGPVFSKVGIAFLGALALSFAFSRWILARHSRTVAVAIMALFLFCLAARP